VETADNGEEAVRLGSSSHIGAIVMDFQMPIMSGLEATRALRKSGICTPIIGLTANADEVSRGEAREAGMEYFLTKPIKKDALELILTKTSVRLEDSKTRESRKH
jgi:CheY-like chemotaxis protein